ncbi:MAG: competence/damage-inducible protein A [Planctomycetes bacterium]|nr:competence/damage-inducible protein A [Planctomycetota bacterium]
MHLEIVAVGSELTAGDVVDTNSAWIARRLWDSSLLVRRITIVGDFRDEIADVLRRAFDRCRSAPGAPGPRAVIVTGGLGPTADDLTREAVADAFGRQLFLHHDSVDRITERLRSYGRDLGENNRRQAFFPRGASVIPNPNGTAPAFLLNSDGVDVFVLPGVPSEMKPLLDSDVIPALVRSLGTTSFSRANFLVYGLGESSIDETLSDLMTRGSNPLFGTLAVDGLIHVRMLASGSDPASCSCLLDRVCPIVRDRLGANILGENASCPEELLVRRASALGRRFALAESCTGGLIASAVTSVPGSSAVFLGGVVAYDNSFKTSVLGVPEGLLRSSGAVSPQCAEAMAVGALRLSGADLALSVTGIAGPGGGTPDKPAGLVFFGLASGGSPLVEERRFRGSREMVRTRARTHALCMLLKALAAAS